jgi:hypothetical protein
MTEAEVVDQLRTLKAERDSVGETLSFLNSVSLPVSDDPDDENNYTEIETEFDVASNR